WTWIASQAKSLGIVRILRVTMFLANRLLSATIPPAAQASLPEDPGAPALAYFRLMMRLRERPLDRLRFLQRLALTPGPSEWQAVCLPAPLFPLYRLVRLSRLAARFVRS